ncbi:lipopolysaccharide biosynthesis protein [Vibrio methylphosphonaticus]|uniref:lipopolysaccharide biosynthesis protein n=1 Tax=Vibrio methylphosphonaticus TaxID=2946866 RepID=UPI00202A6221|nr:lipopolysaccharide biosynthesis protein [Vibrio methylphosphonaticus]MCL9775460.1 lipopolysaccharide biosynthesis protein [Vibrio methylphosphonaticus]
MPENLNKKVISGVFYKSLELIGTQGVQLIISIILARLLAPKDFGVIALVTVFIQIFSCLIVVGLPSALIQKQNTTIEEESSVFFVNIIISIFVYIILYSTAPNIAYYYDQNSLVNIIRCLSIIIVINAVGQIHLTLLTKSINFKAILKVNTISIFISGATGVILAYLDYGVWALISQQIINATIKSLLLWLVCHWKPIFVLNLSSIRELYEFGFKLMLSGLIGTVFNNLYTLCIGKVYTPTDLAFYSRSKQLPWVVLNTSSSIVSSIMFPLFSKINNDIEKMKYTARNMLKMIYFFICPLSIGLIVVSEPLVEILLTEKWLPIVPYMQLMTFVCFFLPLQGLNLELIKSLGRSDLYLKMEIVKKTLLVIGLICTFKLGVIYMIFAQVLLGFVNAIIDSHYAGKLSKYSTVEQFMDIMPSLLSSLIMGVVCLLMNSHLPGSPLPKIIVSCVLGLSVYILLSIIIRNASFFKIVKFVKNRTI